MTGSQWWRVEPPAVADDIGTFLVLVVDGRIAVTAKLYIEIVQISDRWADARSDLERAGFVCTMTSE